MLLNKKSIFHLRAIALSMIATFILSSSQLTVAATEVLDRVVAIVGEDVVTQSELDDRLLEITARVQQSGLALPSQDVLKKQVLDKLVTETLQLNMAKHFNLTTSDQEVLDAIDNIVKSKKLTHDALEKTLQLEGRTLNEFKENLRREITMRNITQGVVASRIKISEQEITNFLKSADAKFWISPDYHLAHILIAIPPSATNEDIEKAKSKANAIYKKLKKGAKFGEIAIAESSGPAALKGGDLGWRKSSDLPTLFAEIAPKLKKRDISKPARSQAGFHILKLINKRGETKQIITQTKARHILLKTSAILTAEQAKNKLRQLRKAIIDGEDFAKLAKQHSDDIGTKLSGGDLGWSRPGMFVPAFEQTMENTQIDEISQPFESQFGWHILQVVDRREEDMTEEAIRLKARNLLMSRRFEDEVQIWLQEMKDDAFIEIKI